MIKNCIDEKIEKKIFNELFLCRIPQYKTMSTDYLKIFGTPTTFNPDIDRELSKELIKVMIPISKMLDYFKEGIVVRVIHEKDTLNIYESITMYLRQWREQLYVGLNNGNAPLEDLISMDEFAQAIYPYASSHFKDDSILSTLNQFRKSNKLMAHGLIGRLNKNPKEDPNKKEEVPQRESMADFFKETSIGLKRWQ